MSETHTPQPKTPFLATVAAMALLATALLQLPAFRSEAHAQGNGQSLVGTWEVQVTIFDCVTGALRTPTHPDLQTYLPSGSLFQGGSRVGPTAMGVRSRTVGQGIWERTGGNTYRSVYKFFQFDTNGEHIRSAEVTRTIKLGGKGNWMESTGTIRSFDADGRQQPVVNCTAETGERLSFAD